MMSTIRRELRLEEGSRPTLQVSDGDLILRHPGRSIFELRGSVPVDGPQDCDEVSAQVINDVPDQASAAEALFRQAEVGEMRLATNSIVIAEIV